MEAISAGVRHTWTLSGCSFGRMSRKTESKTLEGTSFLSRFSESLRSYFVKPQFLSFALYELSSPSTFMRHLLQLHHPSADAPAPRNSTKNHHLTFPAHFCARTDGPIDSPRITLAMYAVRNDLTGWRRKTWR